MTFATRSYASFNRLVLAGLLATAGAAAMAQAPVAPPPAPMAAGMHGGHGERMGRYDPAKRQAWMAKRQADMKAKLAITPAQEGAWRTFTASMQPPAYGAHPTAEQRAEFEKLTTPQRIDKMRDMRTQRMTEMTAAMDKRGEATKVFYAALTPAQQKVFDSEHAKRGHHGGKGGGHGGYSHGAPKG